MTTIRLPVCNTGYHAPGHRTPRGEGHTAYKAFSAAAVARVSFSR